MNQRKVIGILLFLIFIVCIGIGIYIQKISSINDTNALEIAEVSYGDKVTDECTKEAEEIALKANSIEKRVSPNATFVIKKIYKQCGHETKEFISAPMIVVNMTEEELKKVYEGWEIISFSNNEVVLKKEEDGICNEHYVLREDEGQIIVYGLDKDNNEKVLEKTGIIVEYLPEDDRDNLKKGIFVNGKDSLNRVLEDFE